MSETVRLSLDEARALIGDALVSSGLEQAAATSVAEALVAAEAEGQVGHGFSRLEDYAAQVRSGKVNRSAEVTVDASLPTALMIDAGYGFAYPALDVAIVQGGAAALKYGTASMAITRSHHCGALSVQVEKLARMGLVGMMFANTPAAIAPWGSSKPVFGTNPIAFAAPREDAPLVIDLSLSRVARGKVMHAKKSGTTIPDNWALDKDGTPTTDPDAALDGSMLPIGEAKGTALALMVETLAAVMTGANLSAEASSFFHADGPRPGVGQFLIAMKPVNPVGFADQFERLLGGIAALAGARLPGTRRLQAMAEAEQNGIAVPSHYVQMARHLAGI
jgi:(2R)-3-sulfolactate dehydrogenase (NADP+)